MGIYCLKARELMVEIKRGECKLFDGDSGLEGALQYYKANIILIHAPAAGDLFVILNELSNFNLCISIWYFD
jgi:hypothetical protein